MGILNKQSLDKSRRGFLITSSAFAAGLVVLKTLWPFNKPEEKTKKFLTRDGRLVEVRIKDLPFTKKKISTEQLKKWIWK